MTDAIADVTVDLLTAGDEEFTLTVAQDLESIVEAVKNFVGEYNDVQDAISDATAYRLVKLRGKLKTFDARLLEAMCDALDVEPGDLIERTGRRKRK